MFCAFVLMAATNAIAMKKTFFMMIDCIIY